MHKAVLNRFESAATHTLGELVIAGVKFYIIERPWLNNASNISCIPCGIYHAVYLARTASGKYRNVHWLQNVPNRSGVLQHNGNKASHSRGCLIIGKRIGWLGGDRAVLNSRTALDEFEEIAAKQPVDFHIQMAQ